MDRSNRLRGVLRLRSLHFDWLAGWLDTRTGIYDLGVADVLLCLHKLCGSGNSWFLFVASGGEQQTPSFERCEPRGRNTSKIKGLIPPPLFNGICESSLPDHARD